MFHFLCSIREREQLSELAQAMQMSSGNAMRIALAALYAHIIVGQPSCANGQACYVPHMHPHHPPTAKSLPSMQEAA